MGACSALGMEPPVISIGEGEGELVILKIIFSHIHMISVAREIVHGFVCKLYLFLRKLPAYIAALNQFFLDLRQVSLTSCNVQRCADGFQVGDVIACFFDQPRECLKSPLLLVISGKIFLRIFLGSLNGV